MSVHSAHAASPVSPSSKLIAIAAASIVAGLFSGTVPAKTAAYPGIFPDRPREPDGGAASSGPGARAFASNHSNEPD
jgi:hypothetical protein